jgi:hypothetical protein
MYSPSVIEFDPANHLRPSGFDIVLENPAQLAFKKQRRDNCHFTPFDFLLPYSKFVIEKSRD